MEWFVKNLLVPILIAAIVTGGTGFLRLFASNTDMATVQVQMVEINKRLDKIDSLITKVENHDSRLYFLEKEVERHGWDIQR